MGILASDRETIQNLCTENAPQSGHVTDIVSSDISPLPRGDGDISSQIFATLTPAASGEKKKRHGLSLGRSHVTLTRADEMTQVHKNAQGRAEIEIPTKLKVESKQGRISYQETKDRFVVVRCGSLAADYVSYITERLNIKVRIL